MSTCEDLRFDLQEQLQIELGPMRQLAEARKADDDWTGTTAKAERRKRQNRLNQRARRRRLCDNGAPLTAISGNGDRSLEAHCAPDLQIPVGFQDSTVPLYDELVTTSYYPPFQIHSTSLEDQPCQGAGIDLIDPEEPATISKTLTLKSTKPVLGSLNISYARREAASNELIRRVQAAFQKNLFAISRDHVLTIIHYNVYRALTLNMELLEIPHGCLCHDSCLLVDPTRPLPKLLQPTAMQRTVPHQPWIDILPFPRMRDNIIRWSGRFDRDDFSNDLLGEVFMHPNLAKPDAEEGPLPIDVAEWLSYKQKTIIDSSPVTANRQGLIVWRDPCVPDNWEVTPGFLWKWGWTIEGCGDVIRASNRWRRERGEEELMWGLSN